MAIALSPAFAIKKSAIASSSLLALSAALGWSGDALAAGTCGTPNGSGVVDCTHKTYTSGINYFGSAGVDDLTLNVGTFAGQTEPVTVKGSILISTYNFQTTSSANEALNIGSNVSISQSGYRGRGVEVAAYSSGKKSVAAVNNYGSIYVTGENTRGIDAGANVYASDLHPSVNSTVNINNGGTISATYGIYGVARASAGDVAKAISHGTATVYNSGTVDGIVEVFTQSAGEGTTTGHGFGVFSGDNVGDITDGFAGFADAGAYGKDSAISKATSVNKNSGTVGQGMASNAYSYSRTQGKASAISYAAALNSGDITLAAGNYSLTGLSTRAFSQTYGALGHSQATSISQNLGSIQSTAGVTTGISSSAEVYGGTIGYLSSQKNRVNGYALSEVLNAGTVDVTDKGISTESFARIRSHGQTGAVAASYVSNSGTLTVSGAVAFVDGIYTLATSKADSEYSGSSAASSKIVNSGEISVSGGEDAAAGIFSKISSTTYFSRKNTAVSSTYIDNSGKLDVAISDGILAQGICSYASAYAELASQTAYSEAISNIRNTADISVSGDDAFGIVSKTISKAISSYASAAKAISHIYNDAKITISGGIDPDGLQVSAIRNIADAYADGSANQLSDAYAIVENKGPVSTSGRKTSGAYVAAVANSRSNATAYSSAYAAMTNSGSIKTIGDYSTGITMLSFANAYGSDVTATAMSKVDNSSPIVTAGAYSDGIFAKSYATANSNAPETTSTANAFTAIKNTGNIATSGNTSNGVFATSYAAAGLLSAPGGSPYTGIANATSVVNNSGTITTTGGAHYDSGANGIYASASTKAYGFRNAYATSVASVINSGAVTTSGAAADGIEALAVSKAYGAKGCIFCFAGGYTIARSYATVANSGAIATSGDYAAGISAISNGYAITKGFSYSYDESAVINSGAIATSGAHSAGIAAVSEGIGAFRYFSNANVSTIAAVNNSGTISTTGDNSAGIYTVSQAVAVGLQRSVAYANTFITNAGNISTTGANSTDISSETIAYSVQGNGIVRGTAYVTNGGALTATGAYSSGVTSVVAGYSTKPSATYHSSIGQVVTTSVTGNSGSIIVSGAYANGMVSLSQAVAQSYYYSQTTAYAAAANSGKIKASGGGAGGIIAQASAINLTRPTSYYFSQSRAYATVSNSGTVSATGAGIEAAAVAQASGGTITGADATTKVLNTGSVTGGSIGIQAYAGAAAYAGTYATSPATATASATVVNQGSVTATGAGGVGAFVASSAKTGAGAVASISTLVNAGAISASGAGGIGAKVEGAYATVLTYAGSSISGGTGAGAVGVYMNGALSTIANSGTITSANDAAIDMTALAANIISNAGTITGTVTMTTGAKGQNVLYNYGTWNAVGGNSSFAHGAGGGSNLVNEAGGTIVVVGNQTFAGLDDFTNLGRIDMTQAASAGFGARPAFETLVVSGDYDGIGGTLAVDASTVGGMNGDELVIEGTASGETKIKPTILGTPGQTTGNGIPLVSAHATSGGASNFVLAGNAANGDEVAGAFEYNLAFEPGSGTAGEWFLQSKIYPGTYQFGQTQSSALLVSDQVNPSLEGLMSQAMGGTVQNASLDTSQQVASADSTFVPPPNGTGLSGWGRFDEARFNVDPSGSPFANYKLRVDSLQAGIDGTWHNAGNLVIFGGYITPFHAWADSASLGGHIGISGTAYGIYGMWFSGPWAAGLRLNTDNSTAQISDTFIGTNASVKPYQRGAQAAVSYDMPLDWADFTPSAELNYGTVNGVHFTDGVGDLVQVGATNDLWGKLNGRFSWDVETAHNLLVQPYVNIGLIYRGDTSTRTSISGFSTTTNVNGWDGDFAVGVNTNLAQNLSLSAQADYLAGDRVEGWTGFIGLRYTP